MKADVSFTLAWPGMKTLPDDYSIEGVLVTQTPMARARGFWPLKWIEVSESFFQLDAREQKAVLLHEVGHCRYLHMEKRMLMLPFFWTDWVRRSAIKQELEADAYVKDMDYGDDMVRYLRRHLKNRDSGHFYPSILLRIDALEA